jgi:hypothetical protein
MSMKLKESYTVIVNLQKQLQEAEVKLGKLNEVKKKSMKKIKISGVMQIRQFTTERSWVNKVRQKLLLQLEFHL